MQGGHAQAQQVSPSPDQAPLTAIDIVLEPDATMIQHVRRVDGLGQTGDGDQDGTFAAAPMDASNRSTRRRCSVRKPRSTIHAIVRRTVSRAERNE
jgi:hypothetical protein